MVNLAMLKPRYVLKLKCLEFPSNGWLALKVFFLWGLCLLYFCDLVLYLFIVFQVCVCIFLLKFAFICCHLQQFTYPGLDIYKKKQTKKNTEILWKYSPMTFTCTCYSSSIFFKTFIFSAIGGRAIKALKLRSNPEFIFPRKIRI